MNSKQCPVSHPCAGRKPAGFSSLCEPYSMRILPRFWPRNQRRAGTLYGGCASLRSAPAGGENPSGFHPFVKHIPGSGRESAAGRQNTVMRRVPAGGENPQGFHPFAKHISPMRNISPILAEESAAGRQNTVMRRLCLPIGRAKPPHDGILPAGDDAG
ncbi:MAG: hypothetical protein LBK61_11995 [Spirochaetaceae bacterium]|nr:hypothetical protein [Spirochaetaceae bacterium]